MHDSPTSNDTGDTHRRTSPPTGAFNSGPRVSPSFPHVPLNNVQTPRPNRNSNFSSYPLNHNYPIFPEQNVTLPSAAMLSPTHRNSLSSSSSVNSSNNSPFVHLESPRSNSRSNSSSEGSPQFPLTSEILINKEKEINDLKGKLLILELEVAQSREFARQLSDKHELQTEKTKRMKSDHELALKKAEEKEANLQLEIKRAEEKRKKLQKEKEEIEIIRDAFFEGSEKFVKRINIKPNRDMADVKWIDYFNSYRYKPLYHVYKEYWNNDKLECLYKSSFILIPILIKLYVNTCFNEVIQMPLYVICNKLDKLPFVKSIIAWGTKSIESDINKEAVKKFLYNRSSEDEKKNNEGKSFLDTISDDNIRNLTSLVPNLFSFGLNSYKLYTNCDRNIIISSLGVAAISGAIVHYYYCDKVTTEIAKEVSYADKDGWSTWRMYSLFKTFEEKGCLPTAKKMFNIKSDDPFVDLKAQIVNSTNRYNKAKEKMYWVKCNTAICEIVLLISFALGLGDKAVYGIKLAINVVDLFEHIFDAKAYNACKSAEKAGLSPDFVEHSIGG